ncbi:MAG: phosphate ABC transporter permease subunit PstC [Bacteroidales bacterium]|jgi:phosphate transport system permease protein|nr:phosphate ABC transporter permease subunit PstC [Bacteroidales bacterium]
MRKVVKVKKLQKIVGKLVEAMFSISGAITTIAILLIVVFLFKEGFGLFSSPSVENGYVLCLNEKNPVQSLSSEDVRKVFDGEITNWKDVGGNNEEIKLYRIDDIFSVYSDEDLGEDYALLNEKLAEVIRANKNIIAFLPQKYAPTRKQDIKELKTGTISPTNFFAGKHWIPTATPSPLFGALPLILGTLLVSLVAILIALPLGLGVAIYLSEIANEKIRRIMKPTIEFLAAIPSVVYGFFGLVVLVPLVQSGFGLSVGETAFTGSVILAIMALPTIITIAEDAIRNTPQSMREASLALGATQWETIYRVVLPCSRSGVLAAVVLGVGRAIGETMAVLMITGNAAVIPHSLFEPVRTIPATITAELGEALSGGTHYEALFMLGCVLFAITTIISVTAEMISRRQLKTKEV